jgi:hypothetical protein
VPQGIEDSIPEGCCVSSNHHPANALKMDELLKNIKTEVTFRPDGSAFRSKLIETLLDKADKEFVDLFSESSSDILVSFSGKTVDDAVIRFRVVGDQGEQSLRFALTVLNVEECSDLTEQLSRLHTQQSPPASHATPKSIVRNKPVDGMVDIHLASRKLGCSPVFLKSRIPCTDYTYTEVDGKKEIKEYYWSQNLIDRLCHIKANGAKPEDLKYIAEECCDGDRTWAEEILGLLGSKTTPKAGGAVPNGTPKQPAKTVSRGPANHQPARKKQS